MSPGFFVCNCVTLRGLNRYGVNVHGPMTVKRPSGSHQHKNMFLLPGEGDGFGGKVYAMWNSSSQLFILKPDDFFITV